MDRFFETHRKLVELGQVVPAQEEWNNGTGYFDGAVWATIKQPVVAFITPAPNNRKGIIVSCGERGNLVVFQRYTPEPGKEHEGVVCYNTSKALGMLLAHGSNGRLNNDDQWELLPTLFNDDGCHLWVSGFASKVDAIEKIFSQPAKRPAA